MYYTYEKYKNKTDKYIKIDCREENFQTLIIAPMLDSLLDELQEPDIILSSTATHSKGKSAKLIRKNSSGAPTSPPDIVIAKRRNVEHVDDIDLLCAIEIKSPCSSQSLSATLQIHSHLQNQIGWYLENFNRVIVTDCLHWLFVEKDCPLADSQIISLINKDNEWVDESQWKILINTIKNFLKKK